MALGGYPQEGELTVNKQFPATSPIPGFEKIYGLDGLRFVAVAIVLMRHFEISMLVPGGLGVTMFFFISGMLITRLLLAEEAERGQLKLSAFFIRRFIRLLPPLTLMFVVVLPLLVVFLPEKLNWTSAVFNYVYLGNFYGIYEKFAGSGGDPNAFGALWSLAVEEHFYLLLPFLLVFVRSMRVRILSVVGFAIVLPAILRWYFYETLPVDLADAVNYGFTFTRIDSIGWGVLLSLLLAHGNVSMARLNQLAWPLFGIGTIVTLLATWGWTEAWDVAWKYSPQSIGIGMAFSAIIFAPRIEVVRRLLELGPVSFFGRASYELYLWHLPIFFLFEAYAPNRAAMIFGSVLTSFVVSALAYRTTTRLTRSLRRHFGSRA